MPFGFIFPLILCFLQVSYGEEGVKKQKNHQVSQYPQKIIPIGKTITEMVIALGLKQSIVAPRLENVSLKENKFLSSEDIHQNIHKIYELEPDIETGARTVPCIKCRLIFMGIDVDGNGTLDQQECKEVLGKLASHLFKQDKAKKGFGRGGGQGGEEEGDGLIDIGEFLKFLKEYKVECGDDALEDKLMEMEAQVGA